jgi:hypothetical protein
MDVCYTESVGSSRLDPEDRYLRHTHDFSTEFCLITDDRLGIIHDGVETVAQHGSLYVFNRGEQHGFRNERRSRATLWCCHAQLDAETLAVCPGLAAPAAERMLRLDEQAIAGFRDPFQRLAIEHRSHLPGAREAARSWLRLLAINVSRLIVGAQGGQPGDHAVEELHQLLQTRFCEPIAGRLAELMPNYDSLRHRFKSVYGCPPARLLTSLRILHAKHLLTDTGQPIATIAAAVGYGRQHEFARAFRREAGCTPTQWRAGRR